MAAIRNIYNFQMKDEYLWDDYKLVKTGYIKAQNMQ